MTIALLSTGGKAATAIALKVVFDGGVIRLYTGLPPASPDLPATGAHVASVTRSGVPEADPTAGLVFEAAGQWLRKPLLEAWRARIHVNGTVGWWRLYGPGEDPDSVALDTIRMDGRIGTADTYTANDSMWLPTLNLIAGEQVPIDYFAYTTPPYPEV